MSYNSYGKSDYYSSSRGGYNDSYHGGSRRGSPRGGGRSYSSRGSNSYYQGGSSGGSSSRYQGNNSYGGGSNYNQSSSRNDDSSYRTVRYDSPKTSYRGPPSYDSAGKRPRLDNDSRYGGSTGGSSYKGSSYRHQDSYNTNFSSSLKREYEKSKARDFMFNATKGPMGPPPSRYTRGGDRPYRARGRGGSRGGYMSRKPYGTTPTYLKTRMGDARYKGRIAHNAYQVERLRKLKRIQQLRARRRLAEGEEVDDEKDEMQASSGEEVEEEQEVEEEMEDDEEGEENENEEGKEEFDENADKGEEDKEGEANGGVTKEAKAVVPKKKKKVVKKVIKVVKKVVKSKKKLGGKGTKVANGDTKNEPKKDKKIESGHVIFKLDCPACQLSCITYREYTLHLYTPRHMDAMKKLVGTLRTELNEMRNAQREEQKTFEEANQGEGLSTLYCEMCKLNYRQLKSEHMRSEKHKKMREFLIPICKVCHMTCKSQMAYQNHVCSISHLKAVQRLIIVEERRTQYRIKRENEGHDVNMDNFMVLDSVGSADEDEEDPDATAEDGAKKKTKRQPINVGSEYVKQVTALYCELCHFYLKFKDDNEGDVLARHCSNRAHMTRYVSKRDDLALRKKAEKIHRELEKLEEEEKAASKKKEDGAAVSIKKEPEESSDEENEEEGGGGRRYDRFQAGYATATKKLGIELDLDEEGKDIELDKKEEEILGEDGEGQEEDEKEDKIE